MITAKSCFMVRSWYGFKYFKFVPLMFVSLEGYKPKDTKENSLMGHEGRGFQP